MNDPSATHIDDPPLEIDRVDRVHGERLRVRGRWLGTGEGDEHEPLLVVESRGVRHRFPAQSCERKPTGGGADAWEAIFAVPAWVALQDGARASLWLGSVSLQLPAPGRQAGDHGAGSRPVVAAAQPPS
ncbi:MAG: hypothetical protein ACRDL5_08050, partial [Solirubrobacteraceae bacterium]